MKTEVYLVSCVSSKQSRECEARELYISDWFKKARKYAEASGSPWYILSAEHGLLSPDRVIAPYERSLHDMPKAARQAWSDRVAEQLAAELPGLARVIVLAGEKYREFLCRNLASQGIEVLVPMEGLGIGEQLSFMGKGKAPAPVTLTIPGLEDQPSLPGL